MALGTRTPAPEGVDSVCLVVEVSVGRRGRKLGSPEATVQAVRTAHVRTVSYVTP
jgi:hypothetical protein